MKTPPLLLGATLLFWGWQSGLPLVGAVMGIILESARVVKVRWDLSDAEFRRILTFCTLLALAATLYVFTDTQESGGGFRGTAGAVGRAFGISSLKTSTTFFRWLPMFLFFFVAAQMFSTREKIPLTAISIISRWRSRRDENRGADMGYSLNVSYPYFMVCLFAASVHSVAKEDDATFFWGLCVLVFWALWRFRSRRSGVFIWAVTLMLVMILGNFGQRGIGVVQRYIANYDAQWLSRFIKPRTDPAETITTMGQIGQLKLSPRIVIRLRTKNGVPPPVYLREASYRVYFSMEKSWLAGSPRSDFDDNPVAPLHDQTTWVLAGKTNTASVSIACYLNGRSLKSGNPQDLLPLPMGCGRLENLPAYVLEKNGEGAVLAEGPGLVMFDALYGPGATIDSPPDRVSTVNDLAVPTNEVPALDSVISEMNISSTNEDQKLQAVERFFSSKFNYSLWRGRDKLATTNESALTRFLLHSRSGHCEYFATATVLLLREIGIPARYAVGYYVHEPSGHGYVVRERDAHAWCLVWDEKMKTWQDFDTTPGSWVGIEGGRAPSMQWFTDYWSWVGFEIAKLRYGQSNLREYIFWSLIPVLAVLLYQIIFKRGRRQRQKSASGKSAAAIFWPGLDSEFYHLENKLAARGAARLPGEPLTNWLSRALADPALADLRMPLRELLRLHYRHRFDPRGLSGPEREALTRAAKNLLDTLSQLDRRSAPVLK